MRKFLDCRVLFNLRIAAILAVLLLPLGSQAGMLLDPYRFAVACTSTLTYQTTLTNGGGATTYTFTAASIGTAPAAGNRRYVVIAGGGNKASNIAAVSSITYGGAGGTIAIQSEGDSAGGSHHTGFIGYGEVNTGTTSDIVVTFTSPGPDRFALSIITIETNCTISTLDTATDSGANPTGTVDTVATLGKVVGLWLNRDAAATWTNATEHTDTQWDSSAARISTASMTPDGATETVSVTSTPPSTSVYILISFTFT